MSNRAMPFVYLNMGGEMMYILEQRLQAQNVGNDKSIRVLCDIVATMLSRQCLEVVFRPQPIYSRVALRHFFEHIAHSSVMRLNEASMDKLFDLMTMATKYQVLLCKEPSELVLITLNHLDGIKRTFDEQPEVLQGIAYAQSLFIDNFVETPLWEMAAIRSEILNFFNGHRVKVSLMLREGRQLEDGRFVLFSEAGGKRNGEEPEIELPYGSIAPGTVRYVAYGETARIETFPSAERFKMTLAHQHRTISRGTTLGQNMYKTNDSAVEAKRQGGAGAGGAYLSGNEVKFLSQLLAGASPAPENPASTFNLSIFDNDLYASGETPEVDGTAGGGDEKACDERRRRSSTSTRVGRNASSANATATTTMTTRSASVKRMKSLSSAVREMSTSEKSGNEEETFSTLNTAAHSKCAEKATVSTPAPATAFTGTSGGRTTTSRSKSRSRGADMLQLMDEASTAMPKKANAKREETTAAPPPLKRAPSSASGSDKRKRTATAPTTRK